MTATDPNMPPMSSKASMNKTSYQDYTFELNSSIWMLIALSGVFIGMRISCKYFRRRIMWWDDYFLIVSWVSCCAFSPTETQANEGLNRWLSLLA